MARLKLYLTGHRDPQLVETSFEYEYGTSTKQKRAVRGNGAGRFGWRRGVPAITVFFLRWAAWGCQGRGRQEVAPPEIQGLRPSLAATLNDALTKKSGWLIEIFGQDPHGNPQVDFIVRANADFKTLPNHPVVLSLDCDQMPPGNIEAFLAGKRIENSDTLNELANRIMAKHFPDENKVPAHPVGSSFKTNGHQSEAGTASQAQTPEREEISVLGTDEPDLQSQVLKYLQDLADECASLPSYFPEHLRKHGPDESPFSCIRQTVRIVEDRKAFDAWLAGERERLRREGTDADGWAYSPNRGIFEKEDIRGSRGASTKTIPWDERAGQRFHRATILGDPGFGKSWLLRYEALTMARKAIEDLESGKAGIDDIGVPAYVHLPDLAGEKGPIGAAISRLVGREYSKDLRDYLRTCLKTERGVALLDAWDEVPHSRKRRLQKRIHDFGRVHPVRILLTCRMLGYESPLPLQEVKELEILPWRWSQIESYVCAWFGSEKLKASDFLGRLREHPQFRGLARIPLMLMCMCRTYPEGDFPRRRSDLYEACLQGLLQDWPSQDKGRYTEIHRSEAYVDELIEILAEAAFELHVKGMQQFSERDLGRVLRSALRDLKQAASCHELLREKATPPRLIKRFRDDGILITTTSESRKLRFLHPTFQEYLAAVALSKRSNCIDIALKHIYDPAWNEVLVLLGGSLEVPSRYVAALLHKNTEDFLCRPFLLALQTTAEAERRRLPKNTPRCLADEATRLCLDSTGPVSWDVVIRAAGLLVEWTEILIGLARDGTRHEASTAILLLGKLASQEAVSALITILIDGDTETRTLAAFSLGNTGSEEAVPFLIHALHHDDDMVRFAAARALGQIGSGEEVVRALSGALYDEPTSYAAVEALDAVGFREPASLLIQAPQNEGHPVCINGARLPTESGLKELVSIFIELLHSEDLAARTRAVLGLGQVGSGEVAPLLISALNDQEYVVRAAVVLALARIGYREWTPHLVEAPENKDSAVCSSDAQSSTEMPVSFHVKSLYDDDPFIRLAAAMTLCEIGSEEAVSCLFQALHDGHKGVRRDVAKVLGQIRVKGAVSHLIERLNDEDGEVRTVAVWSLGQIGSREVVPALIALIADESAEVRVEVARSLGQIGCEEVVAPLIQLLHDEDIRVCGEATAALRRIGPKEAVPVINYALGDRDDGAAASRQHPIQSLTDSLDRLARLCEEYGERPQR